MEKKWDVLAFGELLIDFTQNGISSQGNKMFEANPGGAPCNVLAMLNKFGHKTAFMGKVGDDIFGKLLKDTLEELSIDTSAMKMDNKVHTTLAFVVNDEAGDRSFAFYRNPGADMMFDSSEIEPDMIRSARVFHFGTLSMTHDKVRKATKKALETAKGNKLLISFDPNLRESLWDSLELAKEQVAYGLEYCHILKIADNELKWFTGVEDYDKGVQLIQERYGIPLILLSLGKNGSRAYYKNFCVEVPAFIQENTIDTTGAGDTFMGCCLHFILQKGLENLNTEDIRMMLTFANAAAAIITTRRGALKSMPTVEEVRFLLEK